MFHAYVKGGSDLHKICPTSKCFYFDFVDVVNLFEVELFHLYIDPISSFDDLVFDDFPKLLQ
jgi:hypothetical protein